MIVQAGNKWVLKLCRAAGIDPTGVTSIELRVAINEQVSVTIKRMVDKEELECIEALLVDEGMPAPILVEKFQEESND